MYRKFRYILLIGFQNNRLIDLSKGNGECVVNKYESGIHTVIVSGDYKKKILLMKIKENLI